MITEFHKTLETTTTDVKLKELFPLSQNMILHVEVSWVVYHVST